MGSFGAANFKGSMMPKSMVAIAGAVLLASCGGSGSNETEAGAAAFASEPVQLQGDQYAVLIDPGANPEMLELAAREFCAGRQFCQVMGWRERENMPSAMPMVARESDTIAFNYFINRSSGAEQSMWDCRIWEGPPEVCLEPEGGE